MEYKIGDKVKLIRSSVNWNSSAGGKCPNYPFNNDTKNRVNFGINEPFIGIIGNIKEDQAIEINGYGFSLSNIISLEILDKK